MKKLTYYEFKVNDTYSILRFKVLGTKHFSGWYEYYLRRRYCPSLQYLYGIEEKVSKDYLIKYFNANIDHLKDFYK